MDFLLFIDILAGTCAIAWIVGTWLVIDHNRRANLFEIIEVPIPLIIWGVISLIWGVTRVLS